MSKNKPIKPMMKRYVFISSCALLLSAIAPTSTVMAAEQGDSAGNTQNEEVLETSPNVEIPEDQEEEEVLEEEEVIDEEEEVTDPETDEGEDESGGVVIPPDEEEEEVPDGEEVVDPETPQEPTEPETPQEPTKPETPEEPEDEETPSAQENLEQASAGIVNDFIASMSGDESGYNFSLKDQNNLEEEGRLNEVRDAAVRELGEDAVNNDTYIVYAETSVSYDDGDFENATYVANSNLPFESEEMISGSVVQPVDKYYLVDLTTGEYTLFLEDAQDEVSTEAEIQVGNREVREDGIYEYTVDPNTGELSNPVRIDSDDEDVEETVEEETRTESVAYETTERENSGLLVGERRVVQEGEAGVRTIVERVTYHNGEEVSRELVSSEVTTAPVNRIVEVGTREPVIETDEETRTVSVNYETVERENPDLPIGERRVVQEGQAGVRTIVERVTYREGVEVSRDIISSEVTTAPVNRIVEVGTRPESVVEVEEVTESETLGFETIERENPELPRGERRVIQEGSEGIATAVYRVTYRDGVEVSRELVSRDVTTAPVNQIVEVGTMSELPPYVDPDAPVITAPNEITLGVGQAVNLESLATARDAYDGRVPATLVSTNFDPNTPGRYTALYRAVDSSGNVAEHTIVINVASVGQTQGSLPVIFAPDSIEVAIGDRLDPSQVFSAVAGDGSETNLTNRLRIEGDVNYNVAGSYEVLLVVTDANGRTTHKPLTIVVSANPVMSPEAQQELARRAALEERIQTSDVVKEQNTGFVATALAALGLTTAGVSFLRDKKRKGKA